MKPELAKPTALLNNYKNVHEKTAVAYFLL